MTEIMSELGWKLASVNIHGYTWCTGGRLSLGISSNLMYRMDRLRLEEIPLKLSHACWSKLNLNGYEVIVVPYLNKRMELGV